MCGHYGYYLLTEKRMHCGGENQNGPVATWLSGHCPACAERERIVAWLRDHEGREKYHDTYWDQWVTVDLSKNDYADKIERGAHLEAHE